MALIGHNYLSYLLSFDLLLKNQKVLILDDERLKYGPLFGKQISELERVFLKTWGEDNKLEPFINIDRFLTTTPVYFMVDNVRVKLGATPFDNLIELARKFPKMFTNLEGEFSFNWSSEYQAEFNDSFLTFCHRMGRNACRFSSLQNLSYDAFLNHCPEIIKNVFLDFKTSIQKMMSEENEHWIYKSFLYGAKGFYQSRMALNSNDLELFHLFHCLLSPFYILNEAKLNAELLPIFERRGGQLKRTHVREWKFYKQSPWSLELASYEGIIHPSRVSLLGGIPEKLPLSVYPDNKCYKNIVTKIAFKNESTLLKGISVLVKNNRIGTDHALIVINNFTEETYVQQFVLKRKGQKISFFKEPLHKWLVDDLHELLAGSSDFEVLSEPKFGEEVFVAETLSFQIRSNLHLPKKIKIYDSANPLYKKKLNNVFYFGPYKDSHLGLLTAMVDIKEAQQFL